MEKMNTVQPLFPHLPERLAGLEVLAENLWWSWNPGARMVKEYIDKFYSKRIRKTLED
jgi:starch phosphorylase